MEERSKPLFSIVGIMRNEKNTLPKLFSSLTEYLSRGGEVCLLDAGSTDGSAELARSLGAKVWEVGEKHITVITKKQANEINALFVANGEPNVVNEGSRLFKFCDARNEIASLAENDFIITVDIDEAYTAFNIDEINNLIRRGVEQFEYSFCYAHDPIGNCAVSFTQSKSYDRRKLEWRNFVHEVLHTKIEGTHVNRMYVPEHIIKLEHFQEPNKDHRSNYLPGLAYDVFLNKDKIFGDRNYFYFARECMYHGRPKTAIKNFKEHQKYNGWDAERGQGLIYMGDCYGMLNEPEKQLENYVKGFDVYPKRREALIKIAHYYKYRNNAHAAAAYANASLVIPQTGFYADNVSEYREIPHEVLYWAMNLIGDIGAARWHFHQAYKWKPDHPNYINDSKKILGFQLSSVQGWMSAIEQEFLASLGSRGYKKIVEAGSWKGRGTGAIAQGAPDAQIFCVDTWNGSASELDSTNWMAKQEDVYAQFLENTKQYKNITPIRKPSLEAAKDFEDESLDCVFIDMGHTYQEVVDDINAWSPKIRKGGAVIGHDFMHGTWQQVVEAVTDTLGKPYELHDTIWVHYKK